MARVGDGAWRLPAGVAVAHFQQTDKKGSPLVIALVAKGWALAEPDGGPAVAPEEVARACSMLGLDCGWLMRVASGLPAPEPAALERELSQVGGGLRDQLRILGIEQERDSLSEQLANSYEELSLIYQISGGMKVNRRPADFFQQACLDVKAVLNVRSVGVALDADLHDRPEPTLYGESSLAAADIRRLSAQLLASLRERNSPLLVNGVATDKAYGWLGGHAAHLLAVPLQRQEQVLGCIFAIDKGTGDFDSVDSKLLNSIANESAIYLENAMLFENVHGLMMGLLHSLTSAVDAKDAYTCGHSERVALLSRHLARQIGLPDREVEQVYMAGLLHDVGKIGVPESVLQKAGRLDADEMEQMKKHPQIGARILADVRQVKALLPGVLHHHERYDGKGYPAGLAGENIPLMGRIICLADCFDAMTSNRTYRKALPLEVALIEIRRCSGTQFDPMMADQFLRTSPKRLRDLLKDHKERSKRLLELQETLRKC